MGTPSTEPAGLWRRLAASAYDGLIQLALFFAGTALLLPLTGGQALAPGNPWYVAYLIAISLIYNGWSWTHGGQTIGMRSWRLRLVNRGGGPLTRRQVYIRYGTAWLGAAALGLGYLWMLADPARRAWHDRLSDTAVVRERA